MFAELIEGLRWCGLDSLRIKPAPDCFILKHPLEPGICLIRVYTGILIPEFREQLLLCYAANVT